MENSNRRGATFTDATDVKVEHVNYSTREAIALLEKVIPYPKSSVYNQPDTSKVVIFTVSEVSDIMRGHVPVTELTHTTVGDLRKARALVDKYT